ncbi:MAG: hypothetical protein WCC25_11315, partial [Candidatus Korobacteraceae bacterium]
MLAERAEAQNFLAAGNINRASARHPIRQEVSMDPRAIFGISILMSLVSSTVIAKLYVWPWLKAKQRDQALTALVAPHMF